MVLHGLSEATVVLNLGCRGGGCYEKYLRMNDIDHTAVSLPSAWTKSPLPIGWFQYSTSKDGIQELIRVAHERTPS